MANSAVKKELLNQIGLLDYEHQRCVLDFARALAMTGPQGIPGKQLPSFAGTIPADDLKVKISEAAAELVERYAKSHGLHNWKICLTVEHSMRNDFLMPSGMV